MPRLTRSQFFGNLFAALMLCALTNCERPKPSCSVLSFDSGPLDPDATAPPIDGNPSPLKVLVYSRTTGWRHDSIPAGRTAISAALAAEGAMVTQSEELSAISDANLAGFSAIVFISTTGEPFGADDGPQMAALLRFVQAGGGLVGVHAVADAYECGLLPSLVGATFRSHPGNVRSSRCTVSEPHPAVAALGAEFMVTDEIHIFWNFHPDNHVVLRCTGVDATEQLPIAWWRDVGRGRLFVNALGHGSERYSDPAFIRSLVDAVRWTSRG